MDSRKITHNLLVRGSNPCGPTSNFPRYERTFSDGGILFYRFGFDA